MLWGPYLKSKDVTERETNKKTEASKVKTFPVSFNFLGMKENITIKTNTPSKDLEVSKEEMINQAIKFHLQGNISEAKKYYQYCIKKDYNDQRVFSNYAVILKNHGQLKEAELSTRKAIELNPDLAEAFYNLGNILRNLNKLDESINSYKKATELKKDYKLAIAEIGRILTLKGNYKDGLQKLKEGYGSIIFDHRNHVMRIYL